MVAVNKWEVEHTRRGMVIRYETFLHDVDAHEAYRAYVNVMRTHKGKTKETVTLRFGGTLYMSDERNDFTKGGK